MVAAKKTPKQQTRKLAKAPLAEVIFEMRWVLEQRGDQLQNFIPGYDPAHPLLVKKFDDVIKKAGYGLKKAMNAQPIPFSFPYTIESRFYQKDDVAFPIMQLGMGIFATNTDGANYEWVEFKKQIIAGIKALVQSYPKEFKLAPSQVELKYVNFFNPALLKSKSNNTFMDFLNKETKARLTLPSFSFANLIGNFESGRLQLQSSVKSRKNTVFALDVADGEREGIRSVRIESKVATSVAKGINFKSRSIEDYVSIWTDEARTILSPFFEEFLQPEVIQNCKA